MMTDWKLIWRDTMLHSANQHTSKTSEKTKSSSIEEPGQTIFQDLRHVADIAGEYESTTGSSKKMSFLDTAGASLQSAAEMPRQSGTYDPLLQRSIASKRHKCPYCDIEFTQH